MSFDWTPTQADPARRLVQVRQALEHLQLCRAHRDGLEELAFNLERKFIQPVTRAQKGK
jgi:hypothetical protein